MVAGKLCWYGEEDWFTCTATCQRENLRKGTNSRRGQCIASERYCRYAGNISTYHEAEEFRHSSAGQGILLAAAVGSVEVEIVLALEQ